MALGDNSDIRAQMLDYFDVLRQSKPDPNDPAFAMPDGSVDQTLFQSAMQAWGSDYRDTVRLLQSFDDEELGVLTLPDGTLKQVSEMSPEEVEYVNEYNTQIYNQLLAKYGLEEFSLRRQAVQDENQRMMDEYQTKRQEFSDKIAVEGLTLDRALADIERWMSGQELAGKDADRIQDAKKEAVRYGTSGGKRSFSGRDLGAGVSMLAQQAGIGQDVPIIQYPGTQTFDPVADRMASATSMGLGGAPPMIPPPSIGMGDIPTPPSLSASPTYSGGMGAPMGGPRLIPPPNLPAWTGPADDGLQNAIDSGVIQPPSLTNAQRAKESVGRLMPW